MELFVLIFGIAICSSPVSAAQLWEECTTSNDCPNGNFECAKSHAPCPVSLCFCKEGYRPILAPGAINGTCVEAVHFGEACTANTVCKPYLLSSCSTTTHTCVCDHGLTEVDGGCVGGNKRLTEPCTYSGDCRGFDLTTISAHCVGGVCACQYGTIEDTVNDKCRFAGEGEPCTSLGGSDLCFSNLDCISGTNGSTCHCPAGYRQLITYLSSPARLSPYGEQYRYEVPVCLTENAITDVGLGEECRLFQDNASVCSAEYACAICEVYSGTGFGVCVAATSLTTDMTTTADITPTADMMTTADITPTADITTTADITPTAGGQSEGLSILLMLPTILLLKLF